jgi:NAD(P)-dependent dehydrogenase (short-subunit alcohol dehydrogenase family)
VATLRVVATCRDPAASAALVELQRAFPRRLTVLALDVTDSASIASAAAAVGGLFTSRVVLDWLLGCHQS